MDRRLSLGARRQASSHGRVDGLGIRAGNVYPIAWPFGRIGGIAMLTAALRTGGRLVLLDTSDPRTTPERMAARGATILGSATPFFHACLAAQRRHGGGALFPRLRTCVAGGAAVPESINREAAEVLGVRGIVNSWGLTEFPVASGETPEDAAVGSTVGRPVAGVQMRVVDGELRLKGPQRFLGAQTRGGRRAGTGRRRSAAAGGARRCGPRPGAGYVVAAGSSATWSGSVRGDLGRVEPTVSGRTASELGFAEGCRGLVVAAERRDGRRLREKPEQIADELRGLIARGQLSEGELLGREPELIERFGVSRPSLREALRILEAEGLVSVVRGLRGGVVVHEPNERMAARTAALVLAARNVPLADVFEARALVEPLAARVIGSMRVRRRLAAVAELRALVDAQEAAVGDPEAFAAANARFHERLVALAGNQTLSIVAEMLNEIVARAMAAVSREGEAVGSRATRQRGIRSQRRLVDLLEAGGAASAEEHWRAHMAAVGRVLLGQEASTAVDLVHHYT